MLSRAPAAMAGRSRLVTSMGRRCSSAASPSARRPCHVHHLGLVPYLEALALQERVVHEKRKQRAEKDVLLLLEHPHVYTLGRGNGDEFLRFTPGESGAPDVVHTGRGGQVTYHEPGQLVAYPLLDLRHHKQDLHWYVRQVRAARTPRVAPFRWLSSFPTARYAVSHAVSGAVAAVGRARSRRF